MRQHLRAVRLRVGGNVQRLRLARGFSQERLAELAGSSTKQIGRVERGEVNVGLNTLSAIALALSADVADLCARVSPARRSGGRLFLISDRELDDIDRVTRKVRSTRGRRSSESG